MQHTGDVYNSFVSHLQSTITLVFQPISIKLTNIMSNRLLTFSVFFFQIGKMRSQESLQVVSVVPCKKMLTSRELGFLREGKHKQVIIEFWLSAE